ncbi:MAG: segregation/condensation protein A [bacterium]
MECTVKLEVFEGPLDLLLHLIRKNQLDIHDIPMALITEQYLEYLSLMRSLNLDLASDYLVMAATLVHIKSRMLLPQTEENPEAEENKETEDPRAELVRRLLEYEKYKEAARGLGIRSMLGRDVFSRPEKALEELQGQADPLEEMEVGIFELVEAFGRVMAARRWDGSALDLDVERLSLADRIRQMAEILMARPQGIFFEELFEGNPTRTELVISFLALLEMLKLRMVRAYQAVGFGTIRIMPV